MRVRRGVPNTGPEKDGKISGRIATLPVSAFVAAGLGNHFEVVRWFELGQPERNRLLQSRRPGTPRPSSCWATSTLFCGPKNRHPRRSEPSASPFALRRGGRRSLLGQGCAQS